MGDGIIDDAVLEGNPQACIEPEQTPIGDAVEKIEAEDEEEGGLQ